MLVHHVSHFLCRSSESRKPPLSECANSHHQPAEKFFSSNSITVGVIFALSDWRVTGVQIVTYFVCTCYKCSCEVSISEDYSDMGSSQQNAFISWLVARLGVLDQSAVLSLSQGELFKHKIHS